MEINSASKQVMIVHALRIAAEEFDKDAATTKDTPRIMQQFQKQALEARDLADEIEQQG